jgi:GNAT superfamily N-acetyltransferase
VPFALPDGSRVRIREIQRSDSKLLVRGFQRLSSDSRYRRFLCPMPQLNEAMVHYLTDVEHHDHEAVIALHEESDQGVGVARYVRHPERPHAAEVAVTIVDDWQGRGLGTLLLEVVSARAREERITTFTAVMLAENREMMDLLKELGPVRIVDQEAGEVEVEVPIPNAGVAPALRKLIGVAARHDVAIPLVRHDGTPRHPSAPAGRQRRR